jgi:DNA-binding NarL/FixJ family response regulator
VAGRENLHAPGHLFESCAANRRERAVAVRFHTPQLQSAFILLADPEPYSLKSLKEMTRDCRVRGISEASNEDDLLLSLGVRYPTIAVVDQKFLHGSTRDDASVRFRPIDNVGTLPVLALFSKPTSKTVLEAKRLGIRVGLCRPFSPKAYWSRMSWLAERTMVSLDAL